MSTAKDGTQVEVVWHSSAQLGNIICGCIDGHHHLKDWVATAYKTDDEEPRVNARRDAIISDHRKAAKADALAAALKDASERMNRARRILREGKDGGNWGMLDTATVDAVLANYASNPAEAGA